jgi:hypothetical protein
MANSDENPIQHITSPFKAIDKQLGGVDLSADTKLEGYIGTITGAVYDASKNCIVLIGDKNLSVPSVRAEDLAVAIASVYGQSPFDPEFSLDPDDPHNPRGPWLKAVYIPENAIEGTGFGKTMFETDWLLKQYSFGVQIDENGKLSERSSSIRGLKSIPDMTIENPGDQKETWNRLWIVVKELDNDNDFNMRLRVSDDGKSFYFDDIKMMVKVKKQVVDQSSPTGLSDVESDDDPIAVKFANQFTNLYNDISVESPEFGRLIELAKAVGLAKWMKKQEINIDFNWVNKFANNRMQSVKKVTSLSISKERVDTTEGGHEYRIDSVHIFGGVDLSIKPKFDNDPGQAGKLRDIVLSKLNESNAGPVFTIDFQGKKLNAVVLPLTSEGQKIWENSPVLLDEGIIYQLDPGKHKIIKSISETGTTYYSYNTEGKLNHVEIKYNNGMNSTGTKDKDGANWTMLDRKGNSFVYTFNDEGTLKNFEINGRKLFDSNFDNKNKQLEINYTNGYMERYFYDEKGRVTRYIYQAPPYYNLQSLNQELDFVYDGKGILTKIKEEEINNMPSSNDKNKTFPNNNIVYNYTEYAGGGNGDQPDNDSTGGDFDRPEPVHEEPHGHQHHRDSDSTQTKDSLEGEFDWHETDHVEHSLRKDTITTQSKDSLGCIFTYKYWDGNLISTQMDNFGPANYIYDYKGKLTELHFPDSIWFEYKYETEMDAANTKNYTISIIKHPRKE